MTGVEAGLVFYYHPMTLLEILSPSFLLPPHSLEDCRITEHQTQKKKFRFISISLKNDSGGTEE